MRGVLDRGRGEKVFGQNSRGGKRKTIRQRGVSLDSKARPVRRGQTEGLTGAITSQSRVPPRSNGREPDVASEVEYREREIEVYWKRKNFSIRWTMLAGLI